MAWLFVRLQYLLPHHLLCRAVYGLTRSHWVWWKNFLIRRFVRHYHPQMSEALETDPLRYESFNAFFTRALRPHARPIPREPRRILSPCDGTVSLCGSFAGDTRLWAKGHRYELASLLGGDREWTERLHGAHFATLYLAPYNYHRVHMPLSGQLRSAWHVPGRLFSVNAVTAAGVPGLFARNERIICAFEGEYGDFAVVLVGALFVGSMSTVWHGEVTPWRPRSSSRGVHRLAPPAIAAAPKPRGAEFGRFNMGSTVIVLLPGSGVHWDEAACRSGVTCRVGQPLGTVGPLGSRPGAASGTTRA